MSSWKSVWLVAPSSLRRGFCDLSSCSEVYNIMDDLGKGPMAVCGLCLIKEL